VRFDDIELEFKTGLCALIPTVIVYDWKDRRSVGGRRSFKVSAMWLTAGLAFSLVF
jgi:hypothetical protein